MGKMKHSLFAIPALAVLFLWMPAAPQDARHALDPASNVTIEGSSNLRDWSADVPVVESDFVMSGFSGSDPQDLKPEHIRTLELRIPVRHIDTGNRAFTRNLHKYLLMDQHPRILYRLQRVEGITMEGGRAVIRSIGTITAAGREHRVTMRTHAIADKDGSIRFTGEQPLLMSDFGIDPPTALLGTVKAHDAVKVVYDVRYSP